ncbi:zeta toxin family protein [uncultured Castellaniella sp.]|uniref:zeta toxin family protein n=1 Tax=uncultured Castellaniella sp. TaxID=647907 RepID=UPI0026140F3B|nr:zeta toxin family protein [uncultured Castellaniella sp.]
MARVRMFAGPNGSGKSTLKDVVSEELLGVYVNPDDLEKSWRQSGSLRFSDFKVCVHPDEVLDFFNRSEFLNKAGMAPLVSGLTVDDGRLHQHPECVNSYLASVASDFIRRQLLAQRISFSFETVMSSPDKVDFLREARQAGFRTYLYYIATEDPEINVSRVKYRVSAGGHDVPRDKILSRYENSLRLLARAIKASDRAYVFDNSNETRIWLAEVTGGKELSFKTDRMPYWFGKHVLDELGAN